MDDQIAWLMNSDEPWTRYRTLVDLLEMPEESSEVIAVRKEMLKHPQVQGLIGDALSWPGYAIKRHNDAKHPIYKISTLADFGLIAADDGLGEIVEKILSHQSPEGAFESQILIPKAFGGSGQESWSWMLCDSPTLLYSLLSFGDGAAASLEPAVDYLSALVRENGWRWVAICSRYGGCQRRLPGWLEDLPVALAPKHSGEDFLVTHSLRYPDPIGLADRSARHSPQQRDGHRANQSRWLGRCLFWAGSPGRQGKQLDPDSAGQRMVHDTPSLQPP